MASRDTRWFAGVVRVLRLSCASPYSERPCILELLAGAVCVSSMQRVSTIVFSSRTHCTYSVPGHTGASVYTEPRDAECVAARVEEGPSCHGVLLDQRPQLWRVGVGPHVDAGVEGPLWEEPDGGVAVEQRVEPGQKGSRSKWRVLASYNKRTWRSVRDAPRAPFFGKMEYATGSRCWEGGKASEVWTACFYNWSWRMTT